MPDAKTLAAQARELRQRGRLYEALTACGAAIARDPREANAHATRGNVLMDMGRLDEALAACDMVVSLAPQAAGAHRNRGNVLMKLERYEAALEALDTAIRLQPSSAVAHHNRASALLHLDRLEEALEAYAEAAALSPDDPQLRVNYAAALLRAKRAEAAEALLEGQPPAASETHWNLALSLLALGRYEAGWREYEHRWRTPQFVVASKGQSTPELRDRFALDVGAQAVAGRSVLLVGEQGVGDVLMFGSIIPDLLRVAGRVSLTCDDRLRGLFAQSFPELTVLGAGAPPSADVVLPIGSLARLFRNRRADFPGEPYLSASEGVRARWAERLGPKTTRLRVGLAWRGGTVATRQESRSIEPAALAPILARDDCEFISLQYGDARAELGAVNEGLSRPIRHFPPKEIENFEELAGLTQALDVVVSVQCSTVHLAGALGVRCLALLPHAPEWRYAAEMETMPWYRSVRLFRQDAPDEWEPVVRRVAEAL